MHAAVNETNIIPVLVSRRPKLKFTPAPMIQFDFSRVSVTGTISTRLGEVMGEVSVIHWSYITYCAAQV